MERSGIVTLTTDFGLTDVYVGVLKGVIWTICPQARIVDLTHQVHPQAVLEGAFLLAEACPYFPPGTVHLAVVDPGVGMERAAIALETPQALFVAPDNGLLSCVWESLSAEERAASRLVELSEPRYWRSPVEAGFQPAPTFHGRDIFAPAAAHLASGLPLEALGRPRESLVLLEGRRPFQEEDGSLVGQIVHIDRFGNCCTNIGADLVKELAGRGEVEIACGTLHLTGLVRTYGEGPPGRPLALIGSHGRLEIALREDSAAARLGLHIGDIVRVRYAGR
ncbi:MAG: SAM hydrolase/SAM-dependent halogenase family protein [Chloroflexia bacterium]